MTDRTYIAMSAHSPSNNVMPKRKRAGKGLFPKNISQYLFCMPFIFSSINFR